MGRVILTECLPVQGGEIPLGPPPVLCLKESTFYRFTSIEYANVTFEAYAYPERDIDLVEL